MSQGRGGTAAFLATMLVLLGLAGVGAVLVKSGALDGVLDSRASVPPPTTADSIGRLYEWDYAGKSWEISLQIPRETHRYFQDMERPSTIEVQGGGRPLWRYAYEDFVTQPADDASIQAIADELLRLGHKQGWSDDRILSFTLAFVQSMKYTSDEVTTGYDEYPRYPIETLVAEGGDCEDTSILYASLILAMGYGAALVSPPGHMAVGVLASDDVPGEGYRYDGQWYLYAETTGEGYAIGEMPKAYQDQDADLYPLG